MSEPPNYQNHVKSDARQSDYRFLWYQNEHCCLESTAGPVGAG
jgi:hypothetical protein